MPDPASTRATQFGPGQEHAESREQTVERATGGRAAAHAASEDPSTRRGIGIRLLRAMAAWGGLGFAGGVVLGVVLQLVGVPIGPGSGDLASAGEQVLFLAVFGIAVAVIVALVGALVLLAREDGRAAADSERHAAS
jgi:hypothetical protein